MEYHVYANIFRMVVVSFVIDCVQGKPGITIVNGETTLACNSSTMLTCNVTSEPFLSMFWYVDNTKIGECSHSQCFPSPLLPQFYTISVGNLTYTTFFLEIDPITIDDNREVFCTDGNPSDSLTLSSKNVISKDTFSIRNMTAVDDATVEVISNCVDRANAITFTLNTKNDTERSFDDVIKITTLSVTCTDQENPNCGGTATNKANHTITIQTDGTGHLYTFNLKVSYEGVELLFEEIGSYHIKEPGIQHGEESDYSAIIGAAAGLLLIGVAVIGVVIFRKRIVNTSKTNEQPACSTSQSPIPVTNENLKCNQIPNASLEYQRGTVDNHISYSSVDHAYEGLSREDKDPKPTYENWKIQL